ncbi:MAG: ATP-binding protein [Candidatus Heimdallarchaeota archaeon]|nr:ATP-binding protein [Candidatus Heimdallarchaeota archaeon]
MGTNNSSEMEVNIDINIENYFKSLGKQPMAFHDALSELIDNAISANIKSNDYFFQESSEEHFRIQITLIQKNENLIEGIVADSGHGMDKETMCNHVLRTGDIEKGDGILNEHGFGLKNSLSWLTGNEDKSFLIISRTKDMPEKTYNVIEGPFKKGMKLKIKDETFIEKWNQGAETLQNPNFGTRVHFKTTKAKLKTTYPLGDSLEAFANALSEHMGVFYRHFLRKSRENKIILKWIDEIRNKSNEYEIKDIFPVFKDGKLPRTKEDEEERNCYLEEFIEIVDDNKLYKILYRRGIVDWEKTCEKYPKNGKTDSPFRIYYRKNQSTQGVDIVFNGRTISTGLMKEIWNEVPKNGEYDSITRHNIYNDFIGEIVINYNEFSTVNNKVGLNPSDKLWLKLKKKLNEEKKYYPIKWGKAEKEESLVIKLREKLKRMLSGVESVRSSELRNGVKTDIELKFNNGIIYIYEIKRGIASPLDIYQCVMYWDMYTWGNSSNNLERVVLVAKSITDNAKELIDFWNERKDVNGKKYLIEFKSLSDFELTEE